MPNGDLAISGFRQHAASVKPLAKQSSVKLSDGLNCAGNCGLPVPAKKMPRRSCAGLIFGCLGTAKDKHNMGLPLTEKNRINTNDEIYKIGNHSCCCNKPGDKKRGVHDLRYLTTQLPVKYHDEKIRTLTEGLIDIAVMLEKYSIHPSLKNNLSRQLKTIFLAGNISIQTIMNFRKRICFIFNEKNDYYLKIDGIIKTIEKRIYLTKHIDNYYGRVFESCLSHYVITHPSTEMLRVIQLIRFELIQDFCSKKYTAEMQNQLCQKMALKLSADKAPWREEISEVSIFLAGKNPAEFLKMLHCRHKYFHLLILHLAVKYIIHAPGFEPLKRTATVLYVNAILPQRDLIYRESSIMLSRKQGILLHYQNARNLFPLESHGVRPIDKYFIPISEITEKNLEALINERPMGIGISGSANILNHLFQDLARKHQDFPMESARLMAASHLLFSGGHSLNESYTVFHFYYTGKFRLLSYITVYDSCDLGKKAIDYAYELLLKQARELNGGE